MLVLAYGFLQVGSEDVPSWATAAGALGILLMLIFVGLERDHIVVQLSAKKARNNAMTIGIVLVLIGIAIGVNVVAYQLDKRWDLTSAKSFSLSPQTAAYLESLEEPIEVLAFFPDQSEEERYFRDLVATMESHTEQLDVHFFDPVRQPSKAREYEITDMGVILQRGEQQVHVASPYAESSVRLALINLLSDETHLICFSTGHGEPDIEEVEQAHNFGLLSWSLEDQNYLPIPVNLEQTGSVPEECTVFVATNTARGWRSEDVDSLVQYVLEGGQAHVPECS